MERIVRAESYRFSRPGLIGCCHDRKIRDYSIFNQTELTSIFNTGPVKHDARRAMLFDMDNAIQTLNQTGADEGARRTLVGCYHNLLRQWGET